ncbi:DUF4199 domain-containing protein [Aquimarina sp. D1M17]|uniref:DUF4199 domain-containing protein n=1 Tax=Aquimarina acroporae TaxID=2937283 RepID=UPI0020BF653E|nr:DUF4199 domain-containing protein [Aquimarina acroporae]MCK8520815.1 DUF4199 domain-containing protein [Aquimarina acroporae]
MVETTISIKKFIIKYGLILGVFLIIYGYVSYITENRTTTNWVFSAINLSLFIIVTLLGIYKYKLASNGFLKLSQAFIIGVGISLIGSIIYIIWDIFLLKILAPDILDRLVELNKTPSANDIQKSDITQNNQNSFVLAISIASLIGNMIVGTLIALLGGAILQKNPDPFE